MKESDNPPRFTTSLSQTPLLSQSNLSLKHLNSSAKINDVCPTDKSQLQPSNHRVHLGVEHSLTGFKASNSSGKMSNNSDVSNLSATSSTGDINFLNRPLLENGELNHKLNGMVAGAVNGLSNTHTVTKLDDSCSDVASWDGSSFRTRSNPSTQVLY